MASTANNTINVNVGKGIRGGYLHRLPAGAPIPTDYKTPLPPEAENLGYINSDGFTMATETNSEPINDLNGDVIINADSSETNTFTFFLAELKRASLAESYGHKNVVDEDGMITVTGASGGFEAGVYVFDMLLRNNRRGRIVFPNAEHQSTDELTINSESLFGRSTTLIAMPDENGASFYQYFESTETVPQAKAEIPTKGTFFGKDASAFGTFKLNGLKVTGTATKITEFTEFSSKTDEQEGYYLPLTVENWKGAKATSSRNPKRTVELDDDQIIVFLGKASVETQTVTIETSDTRTITYDVSSISAGE